MAILISTNGGASYTINGPTYSAIAPGNNRTFSWDMATAFNNKQISQMRVKVVAGSAAAESGVFAVDTRDAAATAPSIQDAGCVYFDSRTHTFFIEGVPLGIQLQAYPDWKGKAPGSVLFYGPQGNLIAEALSAPYTGSFDLATLPPGGITIVAVAGDGTRSSSYAANCQIIPCPPGVNPQDLVAAVAEVLQRIKYKSSHKFSTVFFREDKSSIPSAGNGPIPGISGTPLKFNLGVELGCEIGGDGTARFEHDVSLGLPWELLFLDVEPSISAALNWKYGASGWALDYGQLGFGLGLSAESPSFLLYPVPPIYATLGCDISASAEGKIGFNPSSYAIYLYDGELGLQVVGILTVGCGIDGIAAVEVFGGGGPYATVALADPPVFTDYGAKLKYGLRVYFLLYIWEHSEEFTISMMPGAETTTTRPMAALASALNTPKGHDFKLMPRNYLSRQKTYAVFGKSGLVPLAAAAERDGLVTLMGLATDVLQANVYPYSQPDLSVAGTNRLLVWIWDDPSRTAENRTELVWSKWADGAWMNPTSVWDEGTADFAPAVRLMPHGSALAVWQNERASLTNGATLDEAFAGLEVAVAKYDPGTDTWAATNLTDNATIDHGTQLAASDNGRALLTWISNTSNSPSGSASAPNVIHSRLWDGAVWQDAGTISTNARMLLWSTVAFDGTNGVFLAALDGDDDQTTIDDQELFGASFNGGVWSALAQWTTNAVQDTKPQAAYDSADNLLVAWYQSSNIVMRAGDINLAAAATVGEVGGASSAKDFRLVTGPAGQISMVWADVAEDGTGPDPFMLNYDAALGVWSKPIRMLNNSNLLERSFVGAYATNGALLMAYNQVHVQTDTNGVPVFTNNVVDLMFMDYLIGGDLSLSAADIAVATNNPQPGQTVDVSATVWNLGELAATNIAVVFFNGNPTGGGTLIGTTQTVAQLAAGASTNVTVAWTVPATVSNQAIYVVVDPDLTQGDRNRANNTASMTAILPDLTVSEMSVVNSDADNRMVNARVVNDGGVTSGQGFDVEYRRGATNGALIGTATLEALPAGGQFDANIEWDISGQTFTTAYETVYATADTGGAVLEGDKDNNIGLVQVMTTLDTDNDGLLDGEELRYGTSVNVQDSDGDGLKDGEEVHTYATSPLVADSDGDGMKDGDEVRAGTDPNSEADVFAITGVDAATGLTLVHWSAKSNKTYQVVKSWELLTWTNAPSGAGTNEQSLRTATTNDVFQYIDIESSATNRSFYRVNLIED